MPYIIKKNAIVGAKICDGTKTINKKLSDCTQEELAQLFEVGLINHIEQIKDEKPKRKKKRDNAKNTPPPSLPDQEEGDEGNR